LLQFSSEFPKTEHCSLEIPRKAREKLAFATVCIPIDLSRFLDNRFMMPYEHGKAAV